MDKLIPSASRVAQAGILIALAGSLWAAVAGVGCDSCERAKAAIGGVNLGVVGLSYYGALLLVLVRRGESRLSRAAILAAVGVHLVLVVFLMRLEVFCPACLLTACGAALAGTAVIARKDFDLRRNFWPLPTAAVMTLALVTWQQRAQAIAWQAQGDQLLAEVLHENIQVPADQVRLLVFVRPGCKYCERFEREIVPKLTNHFGNALTMENRPAPEGLPTPTVIILGRENHALVGMPRFSRLTNAILSALNSPAPTR